MTKKQPGRQQLEHLKDICEQAGIKLTHQRLEIFRELMATSDHPSAELVHKKLQKKLPTLAIDTVYRTLGTFDELGIIKKLHVMGERTLFDSNLEPHHHFVCTRCKAVEDIYWPDFDKTVLPEEIADFGQVKSRHLEVQGVCKLCLQEEE